MIKYGLNRRNLGKFVFLKLMIEFQSIVGTFLIFGKNGEEPDEEESFRTEKHSETC